MSVQSAILSFPPLVLPPEAEALRREVRAFLLDVVPKDKAPERFKSWGTFSPEFSKQLGAKGWIGLTWPKEYGGHDRSQLERYVLTEELLANGAPAGAHWIADRQSGPLILRFGNEPQKKKYLPPITRGESYFCIGMSEPDSGSDLASVRTRAEAVEGGFRVNGTKLWTSGAHRCHYMIALCRTSAKSEERHAGLSQLIIDLKSPGISIRPVVNLAGKHDFNEVNFVDVFVPQENLLGNEGDGWKQVTSELAYERSGPERFLTNIHVLRELVRLIGRQASPRAAETIGRLVSRLWNLRQMSLSVAGMLQQGQMPVTEASVVKDLGTAFQQELPEIARTLAQSEAASSEQLEDFLDIARQATMLSPAYTIQGGTTQILRGIIARGLGLR
ncbi:MAG: acyl-CoA dehydrogenase family protein [Reyranellaceae bacterium]